MFSSDKFAHLEKFWYFRLAKIISIFTIVAIWLWGLVWIVVYFCFNPYLYVSQGNSYIRENFYILDDTAEDIAEIKFYQMRHELAPIRQNGFRSSQIIIAERAQNYENLKFLKIFVAILVWTGAIFLALILLGNIANYVIFGNKQKTSTKNISENKSEDSDEKAENSEEIILLENPKNQK